MTDPRELAQRFVAALHALEREGPQALDAMLALHADDVRLTNPVIERNGAPLRGTQEARRFWGEYATQLAGARTAFSHVLAHAQTVALFWRTERERDGLAYDGASLLELGGDGRIAHFHGYFDPARLHLAATAR